MTVRAIHARHVAHAAAPAFTHGAGAPTRLSGKDAHALHLAPDAKSALEALQKHTDDLAIAAGYQLAPADLKSLTSGNALDQLAVDASQLEKGIGRTPLDEYTQLDVKPIARKNAFAALEHMLGTNPAWNETADGKKQLPADVRAMLHQFLGAPSTQLFQVALDNGADSNAHGLLFLNTNTGEVRYLGLEHDS